jgi:peptidoglycan hydrolase-like protein with peptidoglycan-binding domain
MKKILLILVASFLFGVPINAQTETATAAKTSDTQTKSQDKPKKRTFRSNKEQVMQAQKMLKITESGKMDKDTKTAVKTFQGENGLRKSGSLNRATLEKMNIALTDQQKEIPVSPNSFAAAATASDKSSGENKRGPVFRASKEQIMSAQKMMKEKTMYSGEENGKLDDATRDALKKYQEANGVKVTGTLNQMTLEKMGIELTDKQKENAAKSPQN